MCPLVPLIPLVPEEAQQQKFEVILSKMVASFGQAEDGNGFNSSDSSSKLSKVSQGKNRGTPQDGSNIGFSHQGKCCLGFGGGGPDVLDREDHIKLETIGTYSSGWC